MGPDYGFGPAKREARSSFPTALASSGWAITPCAGSMASGLASGWCTSWTHSARSAGPKSASNTASGGFTPTSRNIATIQRLSENTNCGGVLTAFLLQKTGFVTLDRLLKRHHQRKQEFLAVLERPDIPMHTNGSENDIRCQVTKRKISGGTRSDKGRDCRDAFLSLMKTCAKLGIGFWDYLGDRLSHSGAAKIPLLPDLIRKQATA